MRKWFALEPTAGRMQIFSVFQRDSLAGYIYVEAERKVHVQSAIEKVTNVYGSKLTLVDVSEMVDCLTIKKKDTEAVLGAWIRVKRGKYLGDIAQVKTKKTIIDLKIIELYDQEDVVKIKIVPRIDYDTARDDLGKIKKKQNRPPSKLFNVEYVIE